MRSHRLTMMTLTPHRKVMDAGQHGQVARFFFSVGAYTVSDKALQSRNSSGYSLLDTVTAVSSIIMVAMYMHGRPKLVWPD